MATRNRERRLAWLEAATGGGAALRQEVERLTVECERTADDREFCAACLRLLAALQGLPPEPDRTPRPTAKAADMSEGQAEAYMAAFQARMSDPATRLGRIRARFRDAATGPDVAAWLALHQTGRLSFASS